MRADLARLREMERLLKPDAGAAEGLLEKLEKLALKYEVPSGEHGMYAPDVINDFLHDPEVEKLLTSGYAAGWADAREAAAKVCQELGVSLTIHNFSIPETGKSACNWCAERIRALSPPSAGGGKS